MEKLARSLLEELNVETAFTIPLFGGIPVSESVFVTWIVMAILILAAFLLGRNLRVRNPGRRQQIAELIVTKLDAFTKGTLGERLKYSGSSCRDEYRFSGSGRNQGFWAWGMDETFCKAYGNPYAYQYFGNFYPTAFPMHAFIRKCLGRICYYGTGNLGGSRGSSRYFVFVF